MHLSLNRSQAGFAALVIALELLLSVVLLKSLLIGIAAAGLIGILMLVLPILGTPKGNLALVIALMLVTMIVPSQIILQYRIPLLGGGITMIDVLFAALVASWLVAFLARGRMTMVPSRVSLPLLLFLLWVVAAAVIGRQHGDSAKLILQDFRPLSYYVIFWIAASLADRRTILLLLKLLGVCLVVNFGLGLVFAAMGQGKTTDFVQEGISRFPAPNDHFLMGSIMLVALLLGWPAGRRRPRVMWFLLAMCITGVMLSLVRGYWIGMAAGLVYLTVMYGTRERMRLVTGVFMVGALLAAVTALVKPALFVSVVTRAGAVTAVNDPNVQFRLIENHAVWQQVKAHPILGNGLGKAYLFDFSRYGVQPYEKSYIHNNYLWFWQRLGIVGLVLFIWWVLAFLFPRHRLRDLAALGAAGDPWDVGLVIGVRAVVVTDLVVTITSPQFNSPGNIIALSLLMALSEASLVSLWAKKGAQEVALPAPAPLPAVRSA